MTNPILNICIMQLKRKPETARMLWASWNELERMGVSPRMENYYKVWLEDHSRDDSPCVYQSYEDALENVFYSFNMDRPRNFTGHSASVSDVIAICEQDGDTTKTRYFYVDAIGFQELKNF